MSETDLPASSNLPALVCLKSSVAYGLKNMVHKRKVNKIRAQHIKTLRILLHYINEGNLTTSEPWKK